MVPARKIRPKGNEIYSTQGWPKSSAKPDLFVQSCTERYESIEPQRLLQKGFFLYSTVQFPAMSGLSDAVQNGLKWKYGKSEFFITIQVAHHVHLCAVCI